LDTATQEQPKLKVTVKDLLEAAAHFGHRTDRWNPKMKRYIFEARNGLYIIDLAKTMQQLRDAVQLVRKTVAANKSILFVGTKKQAKDVIAEVADHCGEFYVSERWLGGMLTNLQTIRQSIKKLDRIEKQIAGGETATKKELSDLTKLQVKLEKNLAGIRGMRKPPGLVIVVDPEAEHIAVAEANKLGIPVMALTDTNCDPDPIDQVIACNDDALKSIKLVIQELAEAITDEKSKRRPAKKDESEKQEQAEEEKSGEEKQ
jgi:small subunit ribosomal protein S2